MKHLKAFEDAMFEKVAASSMGGKPGMVVGQDQITYITKGKTVVVKKAELHAAVVDSLKRGEIYTYYGEDLKAQVNRIKIPIGKAKIVGVVNEFIKKLLADSGVQNALADLVATILITSNRFERWTYDGTKLNDDYPVQPIRLAPVAPKIQALFHAIKAQVPGIIKMLITIDDKDCVNKNLLNQRLKRPGVVEDIITSMINLSLNTVMKRKIIQAHNLKDPKKLGSAIYTLDKFI